VRLKPFKNYRNLSKKNERKDIVPKNANTVLFLVEGYKEINKKKNKKKKRENNKNIFCIKKERVLDKKCKKTY